MNYAPPLFHVALEEVERSLGISHDRRPLGQQEAIKRRGVRLAYRAKSHQFRDLAFLRGSRSSCFYAFVRLLAEGDSLQRVLTTEAWLIAVASRNEVITRTSGRFHAESAER